MPDPYFSAKDYAEIRGAISAGFPDDAVVYDVSKVRDDEGNHTQTRSVLAERKCQVADMSGDEIERAGRMGIEATVTVYLPALTPCKQRSEIAVTNWETGQVRRFDVQYLAKNSREFSIAVLCKELL